MGRRRRIKDIAQKAWLKVPEERHDHYEPLYNSLLDHPAYHDLTDKQARLLSYCMRETHGEATRDDAKARGVPEGDERLFYMNRSLWHGRHHLYGKTSDRQFHRDMDALVSHGFVDCMRSGYETRTKSVYRLSTRWHEWGTKHFRMPDSQKTRSMINAENREKAEQHAPQQEGADVSQHAPQHESDKKASCHTACSQHAPQQEVSGKYCSQHAPRQEVSPDFSTSQHAPQHDTRICIPPMGEKSVGARDDSVSLVSNEVPASGAIASDATLHSSRSTPDPCSWDASIPFF